MTDVALSWICGARGMFVREIDGLLREKLLMSLLWR